MKEIDKISVLKGIGEKTEKLFQKTGVYTIGDLVHYFPKRYEVYEAPVSISELEEGRVMTVSGAIFGKVQVGGNQKHQITTLQLKDMTGTLKVIWYQMPFLRNMLAKGGVIILRGRALRKKDILIMEQPELFYPAARYEEKLDSLQPVYSLTAGLTNNMVSKAVRQALEYYEPDESFLPEKLEKQHSFVGYMDALKAMHFPETKEQYYEARKRLVFEEFLIFILSLRMSKDKEERMLNHCCIRWDNRIDRFISGLPYELTGAQQKVWQEIRTDMMGTHVMSRLVQGDVGSGKTIVAFLAMLLAGLNGYQAAMMAPTEVLARQHYTNIEKMLEQYHIPLNGVLLTGSMSAKEKRITYQKISEGEADFIIGTHALIQEKTIFHNLALVVTDEQHRFGVRQRELLAEKGMYPHILVMSATPIPRTLAIILYGDLDISVIGELPKNRLPVKNCVVDTGYRSTAWRFMKKQVACGRQCYVICPMVEESENIEVENVLDYTRELQGIMGAEIHVGCLHGRMKQEEKDSIMKAFFLNQIQILVSTTVVEVGIDVPNASVIMIENAERFGLASLHQLRGRVGRGTHQSYCIFMSASKSKETKERLEILNKSNDGFFIAGEDLRLRGPGDLFGLRQSGLMGFKLGDIYQDADLLKAAAKTADELLTDDPGLDRREHQKLREHVVGDMGRGQLEKTL